MAERMHGEVETGVELVRRLLEAQFPEWASLRIEPVSFRGTDGPVRPVGTLTVEPLDGGSRSRVSIEFDLVGYGLGKLIAPLARRQAARQIPQDQANLKERLESGV